MKKVVYDAQMEKFECYVCGRLLRGGLRPIGWEKDSQGFERCPKHREVGKTITTLGDIVRAKEGR